jgi:TldD protein
VRELLSGAGRGAPPVRAAERATLESEGPASAERWRRRLSPLLARHAPRNRFRWTLVEALRDVFPARGEPVSHARRRISLEGDFTAASRRRDESRRFSFHAPETESLADEIRNRLARAAEPREASMPVPEGATDAILAAGSAAVLFHEILSHPLEAGAASPLTGLSEAKVASADLEVRDDAMRLDLFGGYEWDDEGTRPRAVKLLDAGRLVGRLTSRSTAAAASGRESSNGHGRRAEAWDPPLPRGSNLVVSAGATTGEELLRRLGQGLWIEELDAGSVELASGSFRLRFPRARRVRRGRLADELGPGILAGEILPSLKGVETGLGREVHAYRALGWCARSGQVVPVQGEAPDVLIRGLAVRAAG